MMENIINMSKISKPHNSSEHSPFLEANCSSGSQEIPKFHEFKGSLSYSQERTN
jgi:hypothetical protein